MNTQGMMFLLPIVLVAGLETLVTERQPSMEMFEEDDVLIDYDEAFIISDFREVQSISVYLANTTKNIAVATTEEITNTPNKHKIWQKLQEKSKLKGKLNPCEMTKFFVRIIFTSKPGYLDSLVGTYNPDLVMAVSSILMMITHIYHIPF